MTALRHLRNPWIPLLTTVALACCGDAIANVRYSVIDLGSEGTDDLGCAMSLNDQGWTEIMAGVIAPATVDSLSGVLLSGRALIDVDGAKADLGTLGGANSWMMWGEINDSAQIVGFSEAATLDPNGEDVCGFGTHHTCRPFLGVVGTRQGSCSAHGGQGAGRGRILDQRSWRSRRVLGNVRR
jgi:hypothetical protein